MADDLEKVWFRYGNSYIKTLVYLHRKWAGETNVFTAAACLGVQVHTISCNSIPLGPKAHSRISRGFGKVLKEIWAQDELAGTTREKAITGEGIPGEQGWLEQQEQQQRQECCYASQGCSRASRGCFHASNSLLVSAGAVHLALVQQQQQQRTMSCSSAWVLPASTFRSLSCRLCSVLSPNRA